MTKAKEKTKGPGKGNRTKGENRRGYKGSTDNLIPANNGKQELTEHYIEIARQRENVIRYGQPYALELHDRLATYVQEEQAAGRPLTVAGMIKASGMSPDTYKRYRDGKADHLLYEYMDLHGIPYEKEGTLYTNDDGDGVLLYRLSNVIKMAELSLQEELERKTYTNKGNPAGPIFGLKQRPFGFSDDPEKLQQTNNLTINVASLEEARDALKRLQSE